MATKTQQSASPKKPSAFAQKVLLGIANLAFSACGIGLLMAGFYLFADTQRILLSRLLCAGSEQLNELPQPLFYYVALALAGGGAVAVVAAMVGWWAVCLNTVCMLTIYFLIVLLLLLVEFSLCLAIVIWPHCLGLSMDETSMVKALQGGYGVPGREQLTAAVDLAQTSFQCCAINSDINYDTSLWRLQSYGPADWTVPLTCCRLANAAQPGAYLDPQPVNVTRCQSLERHESVLDRHSVGCFDHLDHWYRQQYIWFLGATLVVAVVEFVVILCIIWNCMRLSSSPLVVTKVRPLQSGSAASYQKQQQQRRKKTQSVYSVQMRPSQMTADNIYTDNVQNTAVNTLDVRRSNGSSHQQSPPLDYDSHGFDDDPKKVYVQPPELHRSRHHTNFRPHTSAKYQYELSRSYLV